MTSPATTDASQSTRVTHFYIDGYRFRMKSRFQYRLGNQMNRTHNLLSTIQHPTWEKLSRSPKRKKRKQGEVNETNHTEQLCLLLHLSPFHLFHLSLESKEFHQYYLWQTCPPKLQPMFHLTNGNRNYC